MGLVGENFSDFLGCGMSNRGVATFWARMSIRVIEVLQHVAADHLPGTFLEVFMAGASPALLTCPRHVGRNRFAYYTRMSGNKRHMVGAGLAPALGAIMY